MPVLERMERVEQVKRKRQLVKFLVKERKRRAEGLRRFAERTKIGYGHLSEVERGKVEATWSVLRAISEGLGFSLVVAIERTFFSKPLSRSAHEKLDFVCSLLVRPRD